MEPRARSCTGEKQTTCRKPVGGGVDFVQASAIRQSEGVVRKEIRARPLLLESIEDIIGPGHSLIIDKMRIPAYVRHRTLAWGSATVSLEVVGKRTDAHQTEQIAVYLNLLITEVGRKIFWRPIAPGLPLLHRVR